MVRDHTLLPWEALFMNYQAAHWVATQRVPGDIVKCGVFKGGSVVMMTRAMAAHSDKAHDRKYWPYDTFEGMSAPTAREHLDPRTGRHCAPKLAARRRQKRLMPRRIGSGCCRTRKWNAPRAIRRSTCTSTRSFQAWLVPKRTKARPLASILSCRADDTGAALAPEAYDRVVL